MSCAVIPFSSVTDLELLGHMTWKILKKMLLLYK